MAHFQASARKDGAANPVTYRHLLSPQAMTVFNPLRTIAHCDIDGAFAQFEQVRLGLPDHIPLIAIQWDSIIAVNYPARAYGIKRGFSGNNPIGEAKKACPHLVVQHVATFRQGDTEAGYWDDVDRRTHKVSLDPYRRESLKILAVFREMAPDCEIEKASIDEAFMDLTPMAIKQMLKTFPHLAAVPPDAPDGLDTPLPPPPPVDWSRSGNVIPLNGQKKVETGEEGKDSSEDEVEDVPSTWEDWALCFGAEIMMQVREEVWTRLHYTCSAIRFLGGKLGNAISEEFGANTVGDLLTVSLDKLQETFGEESIWVYNIIRGIDHTEVKEKLVTKSMLASKNTIPAVRTPEMGHHWLNILAGELTVRLREGRESAPGLWPKTLVLSTRATSESFHSRQTAFPFTRNLTPEYIVKYARKLWDETTAPLKKGTMKYSNISLAFHGLESLEEGQRGIENFFNPGLKKEEAPKRSRTSSPTRDAESNKKPRLPTLQTGSVKKKTPLENFLSQKPSTPKVESVDSDGSDSPKLIHSEEVDGSWTCPKCQTVIAPGDDVVEEDRERWLTAARQEHDDYHFALSLQEETPRASTSRPIPAPRQPKATKKSAGIKAFFAPKR
ncbi:N-acetyltransferase eso1 [Vanrija pseudolonga]|uniref:DNA polymerase eta n=1 Tax=Vanrija pseudolonga TaxID=143232 RepID=A0AAF0YFT6_9TREE|nr:N-acetyltransferase eso1 [Vanrija pseudolonga]